jgi:hypothetical protein
MAGQGWGEAEEKRLRELYAAGKTATEIAELIGRSRGAVTNKLTAIQEKRKPREFLATQGIEIVDPESPEMGAEELLALKEKRHARLRRNHEAAALVEARVKIEGPIGIVHFGDPHIDDDGCDIARLRRDIQTVKKTEGLYGANVGDYHNNWVGRLAGLYARQSTTRAEALILVKWLFEEIPWLYLIGGNHDAWRDGEELLSWLASVGQSNYTQWGTRLALRFPNGRECRINARHDFKGSSIYNKAHGPTKAGMMGFGEIRDHIYVCGHLHEFGYAQFCTGPGHIVHAFRTSSYKWLDDFANMLGHVPNDAAPAITTIIDPDADRPEGFITGFLDVQEAAEYLTWKRKRYKRRAA